MTTDFRAPQRRRHPALAGAGCLLLVLVSACGPIRQAAPTVSQAGENRLDPALSGDGRFLASLLDQDGKTTVVLQERQSGRLLPLAHLQGNQPHGSPSLSWNGRYLALTVQQGDRRLAVLEDRATGELHPMPLPGGVEVQRVSLSPEATRLAMEVNQGGQNRVLVFDLSQRFEPDPPPGQAVRGGGLP